MKVSLMCGIPLRKGKGKGVLLRKLKMSIRFRVQRNAEFHWIPRLMDSALRCSRPNRAKRRLNVCACNSAGKLHSGQLKQESLRFAYSRLEAGPAHFGIYMAVGVSCGARAAAWLETNTQGTEAI